MPASLKPFSPLFIGEVNVTKRNLDGSAVSDSFSPLFIGEVNVTLKDESIVDRLGYLSVPYSSGK